MSDLFCHEQNSLTSCPGSLEAVAHEYSRIFPCHCAFKWVTVQQTTPDITCTLQTLHENDLGSPGMYGHESICAVDQVPSPSSQTDLQLFGHWLHTITLPKRHSFRELHTLSPSKRVSSSRLLSQSIPSRLRYTPYPRSPNSTRQEDYFERQCIDGVGTCGAVVEGTGSALIPYMNAVHAVHIGEERKHQEQAISSFPSCGLSFARKEFLLKHESTCRAKRAVVATACEDKDAPLAATLTPECPNGYNQNWSPLDMIAFNGYLIDEKVVICQWVDHGTSCNDPVKAKDLKVHLCLRHRIESDSQLHACLWRDCLSKPMKKSSLERHLKERHVPVEWACPSCARTFTRRSSLMGHFKQCTGDV